MSEMLRHRTAAFLGVAIIGAPIAFLAVTTRAANDVATFPAAATTPSASFAPIVATDKPAVVTIEATMKVQGRASYEERPHQQAEALGSGFISSPDGYIVTNNHVVESATAIWATLDDGTRFRARLVGRDPKYDLAVLKVEPTRALSALRWGDSDKLRVGDQVLAIGNPFGIGTTVTAGIVSAKGRDLHTGPYDDFIQIDAPINRGNSGGPLLDRAGDVVGINTAIYSPNGGSVGVGFAIPSDEAREVAAKLIAHGVIAHGFIGTVIQPVTGDIAEAIGLPKPTGALVAEVKPGAPAALAGIRAGDVITTFGKTIISSPRDLSRAVADVSPGTQATIVVRREGKDKELSITVGT